ncbi:MAG: Rieske 2Fe-2S domain-containing protein [Isosphaeraceae bacterium]|nr:Rieske 2Fe-2S domain-containing protein [Isosphaeraceae bacterium]
MESMTDPGPVSTDDSPRRRRFFRWVTYALGGLATAVVGLPFVGYLVGAKRAPKAWVNLGRVDDFSAGETRLVTFDNPLRQPWDGMAAHTGVYVRREEPTDGEPDRFLIFAVNCAHLGCPVAWFPQSGLFMCPCHGGVYYANGERASGPPPRGLFACDWRVRGGRLEVQAPHYPTLQDTEKHSV